MKANTLTIGRHLFPEGPNPAFFNTRNRLIVVHEAVSKGEISLDEAARRLQPQPMSVGELESLDDSELQRLWNGFVHGGKARTFPSRRRMVAEVCELSTTHEPIPYIVPETEPVVPETEPVVPETEPVADETEPVADETEPVADETESNDAWTQLVSAANALSATFVEVEFPIRHVSDGEFAFGDVKIRFSHHGLRYTAYRLGIEAWKSLIALHDDGKFEEVADFLNAAWERKNESSKRKPKRLIASVVDGKLFALLTNYNAYTHAEAISVIEQADLTGNVARFIVRPEWMQVWLRSKACPEGEEWGTAVVNGQAGTVGFRFSAYFRSEEFAYSFPTRARVRHSTRLPDAIEKLRTVVEEDSAIERIETLRTEPVSAAWDRIEEALGDSFDRLFTEVGSDFENALELAVAISQLGSRRGLVSAARKAFVAIFS